jgi:putative membrane protein
MGDNLWGVAAMLWLGTGLYRLFALEKGAAYYGANSFFHAKMGMFALIFALELWPMIIFIRWRIARRKGEAIDTSPARRFAIISDIQTLLVLLMVFAAAGMARGMGVISH